jgi:hypothetical protein
MTRGKRNGTVTVETLLQRLRTVPGGDALDKEAGVPTLLGHAKFHKLVSDFEFEETVPRTVTVLPCYLWTHITDAALRQRIDDYVVAASELYRRGSIILNCAAMDAFGARLPGAADISVPVWRPRYRTTATAQHLMPSAEAFATLLVAAEGDPKSTLLKHAFLPERWPSRTVPRCTTVVGAMNGREAMLPPVPEWIDVMTSTGWDNAINRMSTKYFASARLHIIATVKDAACDYVALVRHAESAPSDVLRQQLRGRLRPLVMHDDDWAMLTDMRTVMGVQYLETRTEVEDGKSKPATCTNYPPDTVPFTAQMVHLHAFITRYGQRERAYLPLASRGRKYAYIDTKVATALLSKAKKGAKRRRSEGDEAAEGGEDEVKAAEDEGDVEAAEQQQQQQQQQQQPQQPQQPQRTVSVGELLGITAASFDALRKALRSRLRKDYRKKRKHETDGAKRRRLKKLEAKWSRRRSGRLPPNVRIDSIETDGVGLRLALKTAIDMTAFTVPVPLVAEDAQPPPSKRARKKKKMAEVAETPVVHHTEGSPAPVFVAIDTGRRKPFVAAISKSAIVKPQTFVFTRDKYYYGMHYHQHQRWEQRRIGSTPAVRSALEALANSGGVKNCDPATWAAYLETEREHHAVLRTEYVTSKDRAVWRMRMFRWKKSTLDRAVSAVISKAVKDVPTARPLVFSVGNPTFAATGPGELAVPTAALTVAFRRGVTRQRSYGRRVVVMSPDEFRTTMCCCGCGAVTQPAIVWSRRRQGDGGLARVRAQSRRLRSCTQCSAIGKLRDRDIQAARNILWISVNEYYGLERPEYLTRP